MVEKDTKWHQLLHSHYRSRQTRCEKCKGVIELPVKHFLCGHSFHMSCLGENINMCLVCEKKQKEIIQRKVDSFEDAQSTFPNPVYSLSLCETDPVSHLSSMLQTEIMTVTEPEKDRKDRETLLKEYKTN